MVRDHVIPIEIILMVIDELSWRGDLETLVALSETCHVFNIPCRKRIFSKIALGVQQEFLDAGILALTIPNMNEIFSSTPSIATYVHRATINITNTDLNGNLLLPLLKKLNSLTNLRLTSEIAWNANISENWKDMSPAMELCVKHLLQIPSLFELEIFRLQRIPISLFAAIPQVRHLRLHASTISSRLIETQPATIPTPICSPLTLLDIRRKSINSIHRITLDNRHVDFSGLKELYISLEERTDMLFLHKFLKAIRALDLLSVNCTFTL